MKTDVFILGVVLAFVIGFVVGNTLTFYVVFASVGEVLEGVHVDSVNLDFNESLFADKLVEYADSVAYNNSVRVNGSV